MNRARIVWTLFWRMFVISAFVLGGGFAIIAVADELFSKKLKWTKEGEILGQLPVFQMVPGMICTNTAIYIGSKMAGAVGAAAALAGTVLPSIVIFTAVTVGYDVIPVGNPILDAAFVGLRAALAGIVAALVVRSWTKSVRGVYGYFAVAVATFLIGACGIAAFWVILGAAVVGIGLECAAAQRATAARTKTFRSAFWAIPLVFLKYGLVAFGGGYVLVPMYISDFVGPSAPHLQLASETFANVMALTQMTPGSISVNCATFFGYRMGGVLGAAAATAAMVLPNYVLLLLVLRSLDKFRTSPVVRGLLSGIRPVTMSLMLTALWAFAGMSVWSVGDGGAIRFDCVAAALALATGVASYMRKLGVVALIFASAGASILARQLACGPIFF